MANIDVRVEINHLNNICRTGNLTTAIFTFDYQKENYKCFYCLNGDVMPIAPENYKIGLNLSIKDNEINNYFHEENNYKKLKQIHPVGFKYRYILQSNDRGNYKDNLRYSSTSNKHMYNSNMSKSC